MSKKHASSEMCQCQYFQQTCSENLHKTTAHNARYVSGIFEYEEKGEE